MTKKYSIRYLTAAEQDLEDIFDYICKDNSSAALTFLEKIDTLILKLAENPHLGVIPKDRRLKDLGYRMLIINNYIVFYVVKTRTVQIRRIIHGARQYTFLL